MVSSNSFKFVMLPPQTDTTRGWARRLAEAVPEVRVVVAEDADTAAREIVDAEAAFGGSARSSCRRPRTCAGCRRLWPRRRPATTTPSWSAIL